MRVRTEAKREAILDTAAQVFMELGYGRTSMSEIAARLGGSKATLYSYFPSKEQLFFEVVQFKVGAEVGPAFQELPSLVQEDPRALLTRLGERLLAAITAPEAIAVRRMVIAEALKSDIGRQFWTHGPQQVLDSVAAYLAGATQAGRLEVKNPPAAAQHVLALFGSEIDWRWTFGVQNTFTRAQLKQAVARAVDVIMAAYGPRRGA
ncbi:MAG: TetR/AcrR family transcriptional regulator [Ideonella sp.]|nr:TetR/AcrR family transcriptional regulator [Ideonella sp.]